MRRRVVERGGQGGQILTRLAKESRGFCTRNWAKRQILKMKVAFIYTLK